MEFQRAVKALEEFGLLEVRSERIEHARSKKGKARWMTFYRSIVGTREEGWSPEPWELLTHGMILDRTRDVLSKEVLYWAGLDDSNPYYRILKLDKETFEKVQNHIEQRLVEIFGQELLDRERSENQWMIKLS